MNTFKYLLIAIATLGFLVSCGSSKRTVNHAKELTTEAKLEAQYKLYKGIPYKYGGTDKNGFDCSGFVGTVYKDAFQVVLPRTTKEMATKGRKVSIKALKAGDLVFFRPTRRYRHVGIYVGDGYFIHSSTSQGIIKSKLENVYWEKKYRQARRILKTR